MKTFEIFGTKIIPNDKQYEFFKAREKFLLYGGAKGGGKSWAIRWKQILRRWRYPGSKGLLLRRVFPELLRNHINKIQEEIPFAYYSYNEWKHVFTFPNGSTLELGHCQNDSDVLIYQGSEYDDIGIDQAEQFSEYQFDMLRSILRTTRKDLTTQMYLGANPGGIGHAWVKRLFIDQRLPEYGFIPAKVYDNPVLIQSDPGYLEELNKLPENLKRAYLEGDWDIFAGQVFSEFRRTTHVIKPFLPKKEFPHFIWIDWGYSGRESDEGAFAAYASALVKVNFQGESFNRVITYKEWYGRQKNPHEWAAIIYNDTNGRLFREGVGDSSMLNPKTDGSTSIAKLMEQKWVELNGGQFWLKIKPGTKNRLERVATAHNWLQMAPDGLPYWLISESCQHLIRTLPQLVYDDHNIEDVNTEQEDHPYDAVTYGLAQVKFIPIYLGGIAPKPDQKKGLPAAVMNLDLSEFEAAKESKRDWRAI